MSDFVNFIEPRDEFFWLSNINKATIVTNLSTGFLAANDAALFAKALSNVIKQGQQKGGERPNAALRYEPLLIKEAGYDITAIHAGRSSQDIHATFRAAILRDDLLSLAKELNDVMQSLLNLASEHVDTIVPSYTNGVVAQPTTYAHYLLGFYKAFERDAERIRQVYDRFNKCAMGTTVLNGTSWNLDRGKMSDYLGFADIVENAYDAAQLASVDNPIEVGAVVQGIAIHIGLFVEDLLPQYSQTRPWILLDRGATYASTAMPQKRNPGVINDTRMKASQALSAGFSVAITAHNITPGMPDPKSVADNKRMVCSALDALKSLGNVISSLNINKSRALEEVNSDWVSSQELADILMRDYSVSFRLGHHYASKLVDYGRSKNIKPLDFPYSEAKKIYKDIMNEHNIDMELPLSEKSFNDALNPVYVINNRATKGSANPDEVKHMLDNAIKQLNTNVEWVEASVASIDNALSTLDNEFEKILA